MNTADLPEHGQPLGMPKGEADYDSTPQALQDPDLLALERQSADRAQWMGWRRERPPLDQAPKFKVRRKRGFREIAYTDDDDLHVESVDGNTHLSGKGTVRVVFGKDDEQTHTLKGDKSWIDFNMADGTFVHYEYVSG